MRCFKAMHSYGTSTVRVHAVLPLPLVLQGVQVRVLVVRRIIQYEYRTRIIGKPG